MSPPKRQPRPLTLWSDTLAKQLVRDLQAWRARGPVMEMHALPREEAEVILAGAGATLIKSYRYDDARDRLPSWGYFASKR